MGNAAGETKQFASSWIRPASNSVWKKTECTC